MILRLAMLDKLFASIRNLLIMRMRPIDVCLMPKGSLEDALRYWTSGIQASLQDISIHHDHFMRQMLWMANMIGKPLHQMLMEGIPMPCVMALSRTSVS